MKITRLKLVNFIGIEHGLGVRELELDFSTSTNRIVMLNGGNASGKSTIISQLHPFKDSFDDRKNIIIDGEEGLKEIDFEHNGVVYKIKHIYKKQAQSFIEKDGVELNENGGVRTFNSVIETEFGITPDYFKIGKIASNTENFIKFTSSERKSYISNFLPAIEDFMEKFKIVNEKNRLANADIKAVSKDIDKFEDEENIKTNIASNNKLLKGIEAQISRTTGEHAVVESKLSTINKDISMVDPQTLKSQRILKETSREQIIQIAQKFFMKYQYTNKDRDIAEIITNKTKLVSDLEKETAILESEISGLDTSVVSIENDIAKLKYSLNESSSESLDDIDAHIGNLEEQLKELDINTDFHKKIIGNISTVSNNLNKFKEFLNNIRTYFNNYKEEGLVPGLANIESFNDSNFTITLNNAIKNSRDAISSKREFIEAKRDEISRLQAHLDISEKEDKEEYTCSNPSCPWMHDRKKHQEIPKKIELLEGELKSLRDDLSNYETKASNIQEIQMLYGTYVAYYNAMSPRDNIVWIEYIKTYGSLNSQLMNPFSVFTKNYEELVSTVENAIYTIQEVNKLTSNLETLKLRRNLIKNNSTIKESISKNIIEKEESLNVAKKSLTDKKELLRLKNITLSSERIILADHIAYNDGAKSIRDINKEVSELTAKEIQYSNNVKDRDDLMKELLAHENKLKELNTSKNDATVSLNKYNAALISIGNLKTRLKELEDNFTNTKLIKEALDPNKGIPLLFIMAYLDKTESIANELLEIAFQGQFEIKFLTTASDFYIQVRSGENVKEDIKAGSQGEVALTTISISLALIEQSVGKYNILALDEIDGALDRNNRRNFIDIINRQIDKLGIEQVFVISHNDAFDTEPMDLIILNNSTVNKNDKDFMSNKTIIYEVN